MNQTLIGPGDSRHFPLMRAYLCLMLSVFSFAWAGILVKFCGLASSNIATGRMVLAVIFMAPFAIRPSIQALKTLSTRQRAVLILAGLCLGVHFTVWMASLSYISEANSVILVTMNPIFVSLGSRFLLKEPPSRRAVIGLILAAVGIICVAWSDIGGGNHGLWGGFLALIGAVMFSGYLLAGRYLRGAISTVAHAFPIYFVCTVFLLIVSILDSVFYSPTVIGEFLQAELKDWILLLLLALIPTIIGHNALNWTLRHIPSPIVSMGILGEPVLASFLAFWMLGEGISTTQLIGGGFVLGGVFIALSLPGPSGPLRGRVALTTQGSRTKV